MLWMKAWLEVRYRLAFAMAIVMAPLIALYFNGPSSSPAAAQRTIALIALEWMFCAVVRAGAGIRTQSPLQGTKGLHGSTQFTLSLPVSRAHLLSVRAGIGLLALVGMVLVSGGVAWVLFPMLRIHSTPADFV